MERFNLEHAKKLYTQSEPLLIRYLAEVGDALQTAFLDLSKDCTVEHIDRVQAKVKSADAALTRMRRSKSEEGF